MTAKTILMIDDGNWNGITSVQINTINYFLNQGYQINFILFDNGIKVSEIKKNRWPQNESINYVVIKNYSLLSKLFNKTVFTDLRFKYLKCKKILRRYNSAYCFEFKAAMICNFHKKKATNFKYFLNSIELYEQTKEDEQISTVFNNAEFVITQDEIRKKELIALYGIKEESKILISYNSSRSADKIETAKLDLPYKFIDKIKLLFIGSLIREHCFDKLLQTIPLLRDDVVVIIHGWGIGDLQSELDNMLKQYPERIWISDLNLNESSKFRLYNSIDIGMVSFSDDYYNAKYAGLSAGKLFDFMRVGKPVLAKNIEGLKEFIEDLRIGVSFNKWEEINVKVEEIMKDYHLFSANSIKNFETYEFDTNFKGIHQKMSTVL